MVDSNISPTFAATKGFKQKQVTMKKYLVMVAVAVMTALSANAQSVFEPGSFTLQPKVGVGFSEITDDDAKFKFGLGAGVEAQYQIKSWLGVSGGVMYQQMGTKVKDIDGIDMSDYKVNLEYINVPVMARFYVAKGLSLNLGLQAGFLTKAKAKYGSEEADVKEAVEKFDLSAPMSIAYELPMGLTFEAICNYGITDVAKDYNHGSNKSSNYSKIMDDKNLLFQITVGYKFPL